MLQERQFSESYVNRLREENQELIDEVNLYKGLIFDKCYIPQDWGLFRAEIIMLSALLKSQAYLTKEQLYNLYVKDRYGENCNPRNVESTISVLRKLTGIKIDNVRYLGYYMGPTEKERVMALIKMQTKRIA